MVMKRGKGMGGWMYGGRVPTWFHAQCCCAKIPTSYGCIDFFSHDMSVTERKRRMECQGTKEPSFAFNHINRHIRL